MKIVVYDLEIANDIDRDKNNPTGTIGWNDHHLMHISVGAAFNYATGDYRVFHKDNLQDLVDMLSEASLVANFNGIHFDNKLITAEIERLGLTPAEFKTFSEFKTALDLKTYDLYVESKHGAGAGQFDRGFKLDEHLDAMWGKSAMKFMDGKDAPREWREGNIGKITDYCLSDVRRERQLFEAAWYTGKFRSAGSPKGHKVRRPQERLGLPESAKLPYNCLSQEDRLTIQGGGEFVAKSV